MYKVNDIINCTVCGIENYGIFIRTSDDYTGLIHISEISSDFVRNVNDYVKIGEKIKCQILDVNNDLKQLKLTIKYLNFKEGYHREEISKLNTGFDTLKQKLPEWIKEKREDYSERE
ncbi:MAG: S1 RNA-binding domain-containing protein [Bacilli bacterium]|nr:S1 RNA-binding domain-containing protein [Bacilli bacterium]